MKLTNRAKSALATAGYSIVETLAIPQLCAFAAQNSGIERMNYYDFRDCNKQAIRDGRRAFARECRSISKDWTDFKKALIEAAIVGVTDTEVISEASHAYSGRLEWVTTSHNSSKEPCAACGVKAYLPHKPECGGGQHKINGHWEYCTGQYFPTEYRRAATVLLESAIRKVRQARPPKSEPIVSIADLKWLNHQNGGCWFEPSTMRFFGTRIESGIIRGKYFVTSEQPPHGSRSFSLRSFDETGDVDTVGEFCSFGSKAEAIKAIPQPAEAIAA